MKVKIDEESCTGCGVCAAICDEVFEVGDDNKVHVKNPEPAGIDCVQEAVDSCPVEAIILEK
ncbi:MAG: ferredoxin [bacterium]|nr:ferredoxin [bacterium]